MEDTVKVLLGFYVIQCITVFATVGLVEGVYTSKKHVLTFLIPYVYLYYIVKVVVQNYKKLP